MYPNFCSPTFQIQKKKRGKTCQDYAEEYKHVGIYNEALSNIAKWSKRNHQAAFKLTKSIIETILILNLKDASGKPKFSETLFYGLPKEIVFEIFNFLPLYHF